MQSLYNLGGRKFVVAGLGVMGCIPSILAQSPNGRCSDDVNRLIAPFNANMRTMVNNLNSNLPGAKFIFVDINRMLQDILVNPRAYGMCSTLIILSIYKYICRLGLNNF